MANWHGSTDSLPRCQGIIDMAHPIGSERVRGFQPPWYTVYRYRCTACGTVWRVRASSFRGRTPEPSTGAIRCNRTLPEVA